MIDRIVTFSVERRWFVLLVTAIAAIIGGWALTRLPIDAVPDITNKQVQVNVRAPALSDVPYPVMMEPNLVVEYYAKN